MTAPRAAATVRAELVLRRSEADWQNWLIKVAHLAGYRVTAMKDSRALWWGCDKGVPDLICVHPMRGVLWIECKARTGRVTPEQNAWHMDLIACGQSLRILRPGDEDRALELFGLNARTLRAEAGR